MSKSLPPEHPVRIEAAASVHTENYRDEVKAREEYRRKVSCLSSENLAAGALHLDKTPGRAEYWKRAHQIFSIPSSENSCELYPAFQFKNGEPRAIIATLLIHLEQHRTAWEIAQWFIAANGWLDGDRPIDLLDNESTYGDLAYAAEQEVAVNVG